MNRWVIPLLVFVLAGAGAWVWLRETPEPPELAAIRAALPLGELEPPLARSLEERIAAVVADPGTAGTWGTLGHVCDVHDLRDGARLAYERAQLLAPDDARWPYHLGHVERIAAPEVSRTSLRRAVDLAPNFAPGLRHAGEGLLIAGELDEAATLFERLSLVAPHLPHGPHGLARVALARDDLETALAEAREAETAAPNAAQVLTVLSEILRRSGDETKAEEYRLRSRRGEGMPIADPWRDGLAFEHGITIRWRRERAAYHLATGRGDLAVAEWREARELDPNSPEIVRELADVLARVGRVPESIDLYRARIASDSSDALARLGLGRVLALQGAEEEAIGLLEEALRIDADLHEARGVLGALLVGTGRVDEGLATLEAAAAALPDEAEGAFNLGMAYRAVGRTERAIAELERAVDLDPTLLAARFEIGATLAIANRHDEAARAFEEIIREDPRQIGAHRNLVRSLIRSGRSAEAIAAIERARRGSPDDLMLTWQEAWIRAVSKDDAVRDVARARALLEVVSRTVTDPGADLLELIAAVHAGEGNFPAAVAATDRSLEQTDDPELRARRLDQRAAYAEGRAWRE